MHSLVRAHSQRIRTWSTNWLPYSIVLYCKICWGCTLMKSFVVCGSKSCWISCVPWMYFLNWDTWKIGWILDSSSNRSLYATFPIFLGFPDSVICLVMEKLLCFFLCLRAMSLLFALRRLWRMMEGTVVWIQDRTSKLATMFLGECCLHHLWWWRTDARLINVSRMP